MGGHVSKRDAPATCRRNSCSRCPSVCLVPLKMDQMIHVVRKKNRLERLTPLAVGGDLFSSRRSRVNARQSKIGMSEGQSCCMRQTSRKLGETVTDEPGKFNRRSRSRWRLLRPLPCFAHTSHSLVGCLASRHTPQRPEAHVQSRIMATPSPRDLSKLAARFGLRPPQTPPSRTVHRDRRNPV